MYRADHHMDKDHRDKDLIRNAWIKHHSRYKGESR
jgi:hypothetical protein